MAKPCCYWCFQGADFIDLVTTKCPDCIPAESIPGAKLVSVQTAEGALACRRAREAKAAELRKK